MLDAVSSEAVIWLCKRCGSETTTPIKDLLLGGEGGNADAINLPPCPCGSVTTVYRTWDTSPVADTPLRRAINTLAQRLKDADQLHQAVAPTVRAETTMPHFLWEGSEPPRDLFGRQAATERRRASEAARFEVTASRQEEPVEAAPEPLPPDPTVIAEEEGVRERALFEAAVRRRVVRAKASVNKRLCLPPGSEPPADELEAELGKPAGEFLG